MPMPTALKHTEVADFMAKVREIFPGIPNFKLAPLVELYKSQAAR